MVFRELRFSLVSPESCVIHVREVDLIVDFKNINFGKVLYKDCCEGVSRLFVVVVLCGRGTRLPLPKGARRVPGCADVVNQTNYQFPAS